MQHEALLYSLDPAITKQQLLHHEEIFYDQKKYQKLDERAAHERIGALFASETYAFSNIKSPPYIVYYIGDLSLLGKKILGIVGPRKMSIYGQNVVESLFASSGSYDFATVSGMADGVDQLCHSLSIAHGIPTIAVLGGGLGRYRKRPERNVIQDIVTAGGLVLSEFRLFDQPTSYTFPQRNRIIAGLAEYLFLPEAGKKSGSLITVDFALAMKKPVYATPSSIFSSTSEGVLQLMESGHIKPLYDLGRFLQQHFPSKEIPSEKTSSIVLDTEEKRLVSVFSGNHGIDMGSLVTATGYDIDQLVQMLTMLELKGIIHQDTPGNYCLN